MRSALAGTIAVCVAGAAVPAFADVKAGVDAWQQGDYARAVAEWRPLAAAGDSDAQFNLGQAYKLGRGVPVDLPVAIEWFRKASVQGHQRASDNYGLLLFQQGQREKAMPYIRASSDRGEPRAQYILGTAMFNGDLAPKDWVQAYALMTRAASAGLEQASASLAVMDKYIPADQRRQGLARATEMTRTNTRVASAGDVVAPPSPVAPQSPAQPTATVRRDPPRPIARAEVPPSDARTPPPTGDRKGLPPPERTATAVPPPSAAPPGKPPSPPPRDDRPSAAPSPAAGPTVPRASDGDWRVQLGAFQEEPRAKALWTKVTQTMKSMGGYQPYLVRSGGLTRLQAGPLATNADAMRLCGTLHAAGYDCLVKKR